MNLNKRKKELERVRALLKGTRFNYPQCTSLTPQDVKDLWANIGTKYSSEVTLEVWSGSATYFKLIY